MSKIFSVIITTCLAMQVFGQTGSLKGMITDKSSGETLIGAAIRIKELQKGVPTDLNGNYILENIPPGNYSVKFFLFSYQTKVVENVQIKPNEQTTLNITLSPAFIKTDKVVINAERVENTAVAMIAMQKKSLAVQDGISAQQLSRYSSSNAASAMKHVTGATVQDGKYIVMRGLGDRYSITTLNGIILPSTNPYRNSTNLDIIPASIIKNIITYKTFLPNQPGNFAGGNVAITTKNFPDKFVLDAEVGIGINTQSSFRSNFITEQRGSLNWLGFTDGTSSLPTILTDTSYTAQLTNFAYLNIRSKNSDKRNRDKFNEAAQSLNYTFVPTEKFVPFNYKASFSMGNSINFKKGKRFGYYLGFTYNRSYKFYENATSANYLYILDSLPLQEYFTYRVTNGTETARLGALANFAYRFSKNHELSANVIFNNVGTQNSIIRKGFAPQILSNSSNKFTTISNRYTQRQMVNAQLSGRHYFPNAAKMLFTYTAGYTRTFQDDPDMKLLAYQTLDDENRVLDNAQYDDPFHFFRYLEDNSYFGNIDFKMHYTQNTANHIQFGGFFNQKNRSFEERRYQVTQSGAIPNYTNPSSNNYSPNVLLLSDDSTQNFTQFFSEDNFGIVDTSIHQINPHYIHSNFLTDQSRNSNVYSGYERIYGGFAMAVYELKPVKFIVGARLTVTDIETESADTSLKKGEIFTIDVLPSVNVIYSITNEMNLRLSGSMTIARPNMRELAPFASVSFIGGSNTLGNPELNRTQIFNADLRYEWFFNPGELFAVSPFFKYFKDPIIRTYIPTSFNPTIFFVNVPQAYLAGIELDFRKNLYKSGAHLLRFSANFSYIHSLLPIPDKEYQSIIENNPNFPSSRPFPGQSPYIVNAALTYKHAKVGFETTLCFNVFGKRLSETGKLGTPDIYEVPRPLLNLTASQKLGKKDRFTVSVSAKNLLNSVFKRVMEEEGKVYTISKYKIGQTYGVSLGFRIK